MSQKDQNRMVAKNGMIVNVHRDILESHFRKAKKQPMWVEKYFRNLYRPNSAWNVYEEWAKHRAAVAVVDSSHV